jgi:hypothetical protein
MNLKLATLFLVPAAILLLAGCGEASPTPVDIDATVEARVAGINIDATVEARLEQALTAVPTPTATATQVPPIDIELNSAMEEEVLALANSRDAWFLASYITTEALEGLYGSWSVICRNEISLADYKVLVYEELRPWLLRTLEMDLTVAQKANRYYKVESWSPPWALVEQTWKLGDKIILGPEHQLYLIESGEWRYHDC